MTIVDTLREMFALTQSAQLCLPAWEVSLLLVLLAACLVSKFNSTGLVLAYIFSYRWGWDLFVGQGQSVMATYLVFGTLVGVIAVVGLFRSHHPHFGK